MLTDLQGRTALVTGASSGFGRHFSLVLAGNGAKVIAAARRTKLLDDLVAEIEAAGGEAVALSLDVTSSSDEIARVLNAFPDIRIVVNNAGVAGSSRAIDCEDQEWNWTFDVNVDGPFRIARATARMMIAAGHSGTIINVGSITGERPAVASTAYSSSKAAIAHMTRSLAAEWARHSIRVNALAPGYFETDLNSEFLRSSYGQAMLKRIPQRRFGILKELTGPLLLLASDASAYMTGSVLAVDGGHLVSPL